MKIKRVECRQFAGVQDRKIAFEDGLNMILGDNESGKSTVADLIYHLLFKNVKLDGRSDADFMDLYFPKKLRGPQGDVIDGVLCLEAPGGSYTIEKEWVKGQGSCKMTTPEGTLIRSAEEIKRILQEELEYGEGVWGEIVFGSQKRRQNVVECIVQDLEAGRKAAGPDALRKDLAAAVTRAVMETGGVSLDRLEARLQETLREYGSHWDFSADLPEGGVKRGIRNEWKREVGLILQAYYRREKLAEEQAAAEEAERSAEGCRAEIRKASAEKKEAEAGREKFRQYKSLLEQRFLLQSQIEAQRAEVSERKGALEDWPALEEKLKRASELQKKLSQAKIRMLFLETEKCRRELEEKAGRLQAWISVAPEDIKAVQTLQKRQIKLEGRITGLNLAARIKQLGALPIQISSAASGLPIPVTAGELEIREAVEIKIAGVMEMQLMPRGIDLEEVKSELEGTEAEIAEIFRRYGVESAEELQDKAGEYDRLKSEVSNLEGSLALKLGALTWDELRKENEQVPEDIPSEEDVRRQLESLCGNTPVDRFMGGLESRLEQYAERYVSRDRLREDIEELKGKLLKNEEKLESAGKIPEEYESIRDPGRYEAELGEGLESMEGRLESLRERLSEAEKKLGDRTAEEYSEELMRAEADFAEKKAVCGHWKHIYEVFLQLKEETGENPMQDIEDRFREYLSVISDGGVSAASSIDGQLTVKLASGNSVLTYETLSNGTKDTVSLAFRLAVLEHLFPEGGGVAVFDDPFTEMDEKRVEQSCRLIQKYAENNQVIFITCDSKYQRMMQGNVIHVSRQ